jgi:NAD(P)-dependent dehydrogenase (short-subunit alcohol dehydrogenase family)
MAGGRVAIVTGSGKGIGQGIARRLAAEGMSVVVNYLKDEASALETLSQVQATAPQSIAVQADVATPEGAKRLIDQTVATLGRIDVLVNNAGPFLVKSLFDTEVDEWRRIIDGNLSSAFFCIKYALPTMRNHKGGNIVNLGSLNVETTRGAPTTAAYNAAKTGLVVLTKSAARSEARYGIRCNLVNPGFVETYATSEADRRELPSLVPLGALGSTDDIAQAVAFLVSDKARYITGSVLNVHGGLWV